MAPNIVRTHAKTHTHIPNVGGGHAAESMRVFNNICQRRDVLPFGDLPLFEKLGHLYGAPSVWAENSDQEEGEARCSVRGEEGKGREDEEEGRSVYLSVGEASWRRTTPATATCIPLLIFLIIRLPIKEPMS